MGINLIGYIATFSAGVGAGYFFAINKNSEKITAQNFTISDLESEVERLKIRNKDLSSDLDNKIEEFKNLRNESRTQEDKIDDKNDEFESLKYKALNIQKENDDLKLELQDFKKHYAILEEKLKEKE